MSQKQYFCENCGGSMVFDTKTQTLRCENCGSEIKMETDAVIEEHTLTKHSMQTIKASEKQSQTMECNCCGARVEVEATSTAVECPYCGTPYVLAQKQEDVILPDGVLPFQIDKAEAGRVFEEWIGKLKMAPNALKTLHQNDKLQGVYLPYWTFDADGSSYYTAEGGKKREEITKDSEGKEQKKIVTDWYPTKGLVKKSFDDVLVRGSEKFNASLLSRVGKFDLSAVVPYSADYFSGYEAECFTVDLEAAHKISREKMEEELRYEASEDVLKKFDTVRDINLRPMFRNETYKQVILPVYSTAYYFKDKKYPVVINGQTGSIYGEYPKSPIKVVAVIAGVVAAAAILFACCGGGKKADKQEPAATQSQSMITTEVCMESYENVSYCEM